MLKRVGFSVLLLLGGCATPWVDATLNEALPIDFKNRILWEQTDLFKYNLDQLVGHMIFDEDGSGHFKRGNRYVKKSPEIKVIDSGIIYHSKIDRGAAAQGGYLVLAAELTNNVTMDISITDSAQVF